jgi:hypothetical protein
MMEIRDFRPQDVDALVEILKANQQYGHRDIDGPEAMLRVHKCEAAAFLVAEAGGKVVGMIRGTYDGSRGVGSAAPWSWRLPGGSKSEGGGASRSLSPATSPFGKR